MNRTLNDLRVVRGVAHTCSSATRKAGDTMPTTSILYCKDCGQIHATMVEVFRCDARLGLSTPYERWTAPSHGFSRRGRRDLT